MRTTLCLSLVTLFLCFGVLAIIAGEEHSQWFDLENCSMCKPLMEDPGLMMNMTWEEYNLHNGIVSIYTVAPEYMASYKKAGEKMAMVGEKMQKGEKLPLCNSCQAFGMIMMKGMDKLEQDMIDTKHGSVWIITSSDPKIVAELQQWAQKNQEELKKMEKMEKKEMMKKQG